MKKHTPEKIISLESNQVFVFGSNANGFHGSGAAGFAFGTTNWRTDKRFQKAMNAPEGHPDRIGRWAIYGQGRGYQEGSHGRSYAIETIRRPGLKRSTPLKEIKEQIIELFEFANEHPNLEFLVTPIGVGFAGYSEEEIIFLFTNLEIPDNVVLPKGFK